MTRVHKAPQDPKAHRAFRVSPAHRVRPEPKDHRVRKVLPATKARKVTKARRKTRAILARAIRATVERRATRVTGAIPAPQASALSKRMALWPVRPMRRWCRCSARVEVRPMVPSAARRPPWDCVLGNHRKL